MRAVLPVLAALLAGCLDGSVCDLAADCVECVDEGCMWVIWEDGSGECADPTTQEELPPADAAIVESSEACPEDTGA